MNNPTLSKGFHIARSLCSEDNQVPSGKESALRLPRERMAKVFACPASILFSSGNASLSSLLVHRAGTNISSRLCGSAQPIRMLHSPGHGICPGMKIWPKLGKWEPSWGLFLELLGEKHFFWGGIAKLDEWKPGAAGCAPGHWVGERLSKDVANTKETRSAR